MKFEVNIPEYLTVGDYQKISMVDHLTDNERTVEITSIITGIDRKVVDQWAPEDVSKIISNVLSLMEIDDATFYPIVEFDGVLYGYRTLSKMKLGEYIDLERLCKNPVQNLDEIMAILYRPVTKQRLQGMKYGVRQGLKIAKGEVENLFKYYDIEKYDSEQRIVDADKMKSFPASFALGALSFFLVVGSQSLNSMSKSSSQPEKKTMNSQMNALMQSIGDGLGQFIHYQKLPSLTSQGIRVSSI